jgi:cytochrome c oxidase assembly factor CtaG
MMTLWQAVTTTWTWAPDAFIGCAALIGLYLVTVRSRITRRAWVYVTGVLVLLFALVSPLELFGETYLFSVHMVQHLLLVLVVPPLLLLGIPTWLAGDILAWRPVRQVEHILGQPVVAWLFGIGFVWVWHVPALYQAALADESVHIVEHLCFLVTSTIFWWPVWAPQKELRLSPPVVLIYLMAGGMANTLLGLAIAYWPKLLYPLYAAPGGPQSLTSLMSRLRQMGLTPQADQQLGGLLMWFPGALPYVAGMTYALVRWLHMEESPPPQDGPQRPQTSGYVGAKNCG